MNFLSEIVTRKLKDSEGLFAAGVIDAFKAEIARRPLYFAALMVAAGEADGTVGGAANTTAETVRAALHCVGPDPRVRLVSSVFVMALADRSQGHNGLMAFADCAVVIFDRYV